MVDCRRARSRAGRQGRQAGQAVTQPLATSGPDKPGEPRKQAATTSGSNTMGVSHWGQQPPEIGLATGLGEICMLALADRHGSALQHTAVQGSGTRGSEGRRPPPVGDSHLPGRVDEACDLAKQRDTFAGRVSRRPCPRGWRQDSNTPGRGRLRGAWCSQRI